MGALATVHSPMAGLEQVLLDGDLSSLSDQQRIAYYGQVCESVGLNPLTQPFEYLRLQGKLILYARRACTDQLRKVHKVSVAIKARETIDGVYVVTAQARLPDGRCDESIGAVPLGGLRGEAFANALMKAETKAKRRVTLAICGLSMLDETELEGVRDKITHLDPPRPEPVAANDGVYRFTGGQYRGVRLDDPAIPAQYLHSLVGAYRKEAEVAGDRWPAKKRELLSMWELEIERRRDEKEKLRAEEEKLRAEAVEAEGEASEDEDAFVIERNDAEVSNGCA